MYRKNLHAGTFRVSSIYSTYSQRILRASEIRYPFEKKLGLTDFFHRDFDSKFRFWKKNFIGILAKNFGFGKKISEGFSSKKSVLAEIFFHRNFQAKIGFGQNFFKNLSP